MADISKIREHMAVIAADDRRVGFVARVEGADSLKLTRVKNGHGFDHVIPLSWVSDVDRYVFLNKGSKFVLANWESPFGHARAA
jgi:hypothetical protein